MSFLTLKEVQLCSPVLQPVLPTAVSKLGVTRGLALLCQGGGDGARRAVLQKHCGPDSSRVSFSVPAVPQAAEGTFPVVLS